MTCHVTFVSGGRGALEGVWYGSLRGDWVKEDDAVRMTLASFAHFNSSNRESSACEISGFKDANVRVRSSVP